MDVKLFLLVNVAEIHRISRNKSYTSHKTKSISNSRIKIDQLDVTYFIISLFTAQHVSNLQELETYCGFISCVVLLCKDRGFSISVLV